MKPHAVQGEAEPTAQVIRVCREYAMQQFEEAKENEIYVCKMQTF